MRQAVLLVCALLTACGGGGGGAGPGNETASGRSSGTVQTDSLTGLYEARVGGMERGRMCMVAAASGAASFALVTETPGGSCAGAGEAARSGETLRLTMAGDQACVIDARIAGTTVTFPAKVAPGCAYYCGAGASLAGGTFEKTGGSEEDAMRATDLAGDPLCA